MVGIAPDKSCWPTRHSHCLFWLSAQLAYISPFYPISWIFKTNWKKVQFHQATLFSIYIWSKTTYIQTSLFAYPKRAAIQVLYVDHHPYSSPCMKLGNNFVVFTFSLLHTCHNFGRISCKFCIPGFLYNLLFFLSRFNGNSRENFGRGRPLSRQHGFSIMCRYKMTKARGSGGWGSTAFPIPEATYLMLTSI